MGLLGVKESHCGGSSYQFKCERSKGPNISFEVIALAKRNFWTDKTRSSDLCLCVFSLQRFADAKVAQLDVHIICKITITPNFLLINVGFLSRRCQKDILRFYVSVDDFEIGVHRRHSKRDLFDNVLDLVGVNGRTSYNHISQVSAVAVLKYQIVVVLRPNAFFQVDYVPQTFDRTLRLIYLPQALDLFHHVLKLLDV